MEFDYLNEKFSEFNVKIVKDIILNIKNRIKENVGKIHMLIENDNKKYIERFEYTKILQAIEKINNEEWIMDKNTNECIYYGLGNIGVCLNGKPDLALYLALKALKTNNNIVIFEEELHETSQFLLNIINEECIKQNYNACFKIIKYNKITDFCNDIENFNMFIFINELQKYLDFSSRTKNKFRVLCSNFGTMDLYLEDKDLKDELISMDEFVNKNSIELEIYKGNSVKEVVNQINTGKHNYCAVIFTKKKEIAYYFVKNVQAEKIFVNKDPGLDYDFILEDREITQYKKIYI